MADIDPQTGIDLDLPYDDPAMVAIRQQLMAGGAQMQGSRVVNPEDARAIARAEAMGQTNARPSVVNGRAAAMSANPGMINDDLLARVMPRLQETAPDSYRRLTAPNGAQGVSQAEQRMPPGTAAEVSKEGAGVLPPPDAPLTDDEVAEGETGAAQSASGDGNDPIFTLLTGLFGAAAGAGMYHALLQTRGAVNAKAVEQSAPPLHPAVQDDIMMPPEKAKAPSNKQSPRQSVKQSLKKRKMATENKGFREDMAEDARGRKVQQNKTPAADLKKGDRRSKFVNQLATRSGRRGGK